MGLVSMYKRPGRLPHQWGMLSEEERIEGKEIIRKICSRYPSVRAAEIAVGCKRNAISAIVNGNHGLGVQLFKYFKHALEELESKDVKND